PPRSTLFPHTTLFRSEQDAGAREQSVALAVVDRRPVREELRDGVRAPWMERGRLRLHRLCRQTEHLAGGSLVETNLRVDQADGLEDVDGADSVDFHRQHGLPPG